MTEFIIEFEGDGTGKGINVYKNTFEREVDLHGIMIPAGKIGHFTIGQKPV